MRRYAVAALYYGLLALAVGGLTYRVLNLGHADLAVPFALDSDAIFNLELIKSVADHGWFTFNPSVGAPTGADFRDFPFLDGVTFAVIGVLSAVTGDYALATNLFYLLTYPATALAGAFTLRHFGVRPLTAAAVAILFAFLPFHFVRGEVHLFLSAYYAVPLTMWLALALWEPPRPVATTAGAGAAAGDPNPAPGLTGPARAWSLHRLRDRAWDWVWVAQLVVALLLGFSFSYSVFFTGLLIGAAGAIATVARRDARVLARAGALLAALLAGAMVGYAPTLLYTLDRGPNVMVANRRTGDAELFGLKIMHSILPVPWHRLPELAALTKRYFDGGPPASTPSEIASMGSLATLGFVALLFTSLLGSGQRAWSVWRRLASLNLAGLLLATIGGFGSLFALLISPQIRAYERLSIYLAFLALFAVALVLDRLPTLQINGRSQRWLNVVVLAGLVWAGLYDQTPPGFTYDQQARLFRADRAYFQRVEAALPPGAMVFQLPYEPFPEGGRMRGLGEYDHFRAYLHTRALRWSFGAIQGRDDDWQRRVGADPPDALVVELAAAGFSGLYVDRGGYQDDGGRAAARFEALLGPPLVSEDGRFAVYNLTELPGRSAGTPLDAALTTCRQRVTWAWGRGFYTREETPDGAFNWAQRRATLVLTNLAPGPQPVTLTASLRGPAGNRVTINGDTAATVTLAGNPVPLTQTLTVPPGRHEIAVEVDGVAATVPNERRSLYAAFWTPNLSDACTAATAALPKP